MTEQIYTGLSIHGVDPNLVEITVAELHGRENSTITLKFRNEDSTVLGSSVILFSKEGFGPADWGILIDKLEESVPLYKEKV